MCKHGRHTWKTRVYEAVVIRVNLEPAVMERGALCTTCGEKTAAYEYRIERRTGKHGWLRGLFCTSECMKKFHKQLLSPH